MSQFLFVYGSLCRGANGEQHALLGDDVECIGPAHLPGHLYEIAGYPGLIIPPSVADVALVHGELYRVLHAEPLWRRLDDYEECSASFAEPHEYRRRIENITGGDGQTYRAWLYVYNHSVTGRRLIAGGDYRLFQAKSKQP